MRLKDPERRASSGLRCRKSNYTSCGSPPDAVKHLMRGSYVEEEVDGVVFENGPNAVLLST